MFPFDIRWLGKVFARLLITLRVLFIRIARHFLDRTNVLPNPSKFNRYKVSIEISR